VAFFLRYITSQNVSTVAIKPGKSIAKIEQPITPEQGAPLRLSVPGINVDAAVMSVGLTSDGAMDIKKDPSEVAWYNLGPRPGSVGSAVIAGHYGWENGKGSVFNELHTLKSGDVIFVQDDKGGVASFKVRESRSYDPNADATSIFRSDDGKSHLNLITCEGMWNSPLQTYSQRLVVFSDKV
jgi:LPXTG-site transpeptidase (sortase) family protein